MACSWATESITLLFLLGVCFGQRQFNFSWVGPVVVPVDGLIVTPPDIARIELANDEGIQREIRVREEINVIIDCSLVLDTFLTNNALNESQITVTWYVRKLLTSRRLQTRENVVFETPNPDPSDQSLTFIGSVNQILVIGRTSLPNYAREGNAGEYRCEVCEVAMTSSCQSGNISVSVLAYRPVLVSGNTNYSTDSYYVGTNVCILPNRPRELVLTCTHDTSFPTTAAPPMIATWIFNGGNPNIINTYYESNDIVSNANLIIETFRVTEFSQLLGEYTCVLENSAGNDNATTRVTKCCEDSDIPIIAVSSGFVAMPTNNNLLIGQSTCLGRDVLTIMCPLMSGPRFCEITYSWLKNGQVIENEHNFSIPVTESGQYSCHVSSKCGMDENSTTIYSLPVISAFNGTIVGVPGNGCSRRGSPITPSDLCPKPNEQFILSCDSAYSYTISGPGGSVISDGPLVITSASQTSTGVYNCTSSNPCSSVSVQFTVTLGEEIGQWETGIWSECSVDCGNGVRIRLVSCIGTVSRQVVRDDLCEETKPPSSETCLGRGPCFDPTWISESWSDCSKYCGMGQQTRRVYCQNPNTQATVSDIQCSSTQPKPQTSRYCNASPCCQYDLIPAQCNFIAGTSMCSDPLYQEMCCCTCGKTGSSTGGMGLSQ